MYVVIAGCGRVGSTLATWLTGDGHDVTVIDHDQAALDQLGKSFNGATLRGEAFDVDVLKEAGVDRADVFCAVTDSDNANLMAVEVATKVCGARRAIARLYDPAREPAYRALGIQHITGTRLLANVFYEQILDEEFQYHVAFGEGDVEVVEFLLNDQAKGMTVGTFEIRNKLRVAAVQRGNQTFIPGRRFQLEPDDLVVAAVRSGVKSRISHLVKDR